MASWPTAELTREGGGLSNKLVVGLKLETVKVGQEGARRLGKSDWNPDNKVAKPSQGPAAEDW